jgi:hypothetical protein
LRVREKLFWLCVGAALVVLFLSLIPSHYEICEISDKTKEEHCARYQVAQFLGIKISQFLDVHNWLVTALFAGLVTLFTWRLWQATTELRESTDKLWNAGERQLKLAAETSAAQSRDMQASIKVATDAAKAAAKSAEVAENALIAADRAWISINAEIIDNLKFEKQRVVIGVGST